MMLKTLGVVGAGPMGAGIAQVGLTSGLDVILYDVNAAAAQKASEAIFGHVARSRWGWSAVDGGCPAMRFLSYD